MSQMAKQIEIHGQRLQLYSLDNGHPWSSSPHSIAAYRQRKKILRLELQKSFQRIEEMQDPDPNNMGALEIPVSSIGR